MLIAFDMMKMVEHKAEQSKMKQVNEPMINNSTIQV